MICATIGRDVHLQETDVKPEKIETLVICVLRTKVLSSFVQFGNIYLTILFDGCLPLPTKFWGGCLELCTCNQSFSSSAFYSYILKHQLELLLPMGMTVFSLFISDVQPQNSGSKNPSKKSVLLCLFLTSKIWFISCHLK